MCYNKREWKNRSGELSRRKHERTRFFSQLSRCKLQFRERTTMSFRCERFRSKAVEFNQINDLFVADTHLAQIEVSEVVSQNPHVELPAASFASCRARLFLWSSFDAVNCRDCILFGHLAKWMSRNLMITESQEENQSISSWIADEWRCRLQSYCLRQQLAVWLSSCVSSPPDLPDSRSLIILRRTCSWEA